MRNHLRSKSFLVLAAIALGSSVAMAAREVPKPKYDQPVPDFKLTDITGKVHQLSDYADRKGVVVTFLGLGCPLSNVYTPRIQSIADKFKDKGVVFLVINSNHQDSVQDLIEGAKKWELRLPVLKDNENKVADAFGAYRTNETFLLDSKRRIKYHGAIDDQYGIGYQRADAEHKFLIDAVAQHLAGTTIKTKLTAAPGCVIGRVYAAGRNVKVTYHNQIERIIQNNCRSCHRPGQIGPFSLETYRDARGWAGMIKEVVSQKRMPPWLANPEFGHWTNDRSLRKEEIETIVSWVDNGTPKGNAADAPPAMSYPDKGWIIGTPDAILEMPVAFEIKAEGVIDYQSVQIPTNFDEDKWVYAAEIISSAPEVTHHVIAFIRPHVTKEEFAKRGVFGRGRGRSRGEQQARGESREGSGDVAKKKVRRSSSGGLIPDQIGRALARRRRESSSQRSAMDIGILTGTQPGGFPFVAPKGCAKLLPKGWDVVFQLHYTPNGTATRDKTKLGLIFADELPTYQVGVTPVGNMTFRIPPNDPNYQVGAKMVIKNDLRIIGFMPHMHLRGKSCRYEIIYPDDSQEVLLDVPRYDFGWQITYKPEKPLIIPKGSELYFQAVYDNSKNNPWNPDPSVEVRFGEQTWNEMMLGWFWFVDGTPIDHSKRVALR